MIYFKIFLVLPIISGSLCIQPLVNIPGLGRIVGRSTSTAWTQRPIYQFLGIKYGESPRGANRFQPVVEVSPWAHTMDATKPGPACPTLKNLEEVRAQQGYRDVEDCLTLSIHTPKLSGRYPVMFYIHGEFFFDGSSEEAQPQYLLEKDIVLVSVQYRLAPFGFLSTRSKDIPGNVAAWDVILALDWVRKNIQFFGGKGNDITIFGQGSGATLAHLLMITPLIKTPIFQRVILQSGSMLNPYFIDEEPIEHAMDIAHGANCRDSHTVAGVNECLIRLSPIELIESFHSHAKSREHHGIGHYGGFQWTIDDGFGLLPTHPARLVKDSSHYSYPLMGGVTKNIGSYLFERQILPRLVQSAHSQVDIVEIFEILLKHTIGTDDSGTVTTVAIENFFEVDQIENQTLSALEPSMLDFFGSFLYKGPILQAVAMNSRYLPNDTFLYTFDYQGEHSRYPNQGSQHHGVSLSDDNIYLFPYPLECTSLNPQDTMMARLMVDLWTSFAMTGMPDSERIEEWPPVTMVTGPYLRLDTEESVRYDFTEEINRINSDLHNYE